MIKVLFVCMGNICRSPMAEGVFQDLVNKAGLGQSIQVDSAGTGGWHVGEKAHPGTLEMLKKHHIPYNGRARMFERHDLETFDYILAMDSNNLDGIHRFSRNGNGPEINLFLHYANEAGTTDVTQVPDPYYTGGFDYVYELVRKGCVALLDHIRQAHGL